jgi:hypothetical protein
VKEHAQGCIAASGWEWQGCGVGEEKATNRGVFSIWDWAILYHGGLLRYLSSDISFQSLLSYLIKYILFSLQIR